MIRAALLGFAVAACSGSNVNTVNDANPTGDSAGGCQIQLAFQPAMPVAEPSLQVRAAAQVFGAVGVIGYTWHVYFGGSELATTYQAPDHSQIDFPATVAGVYRVTVDVDGASCPTGTANKNVAAPGANLVDYRLRVVAPPTLAPPYETVIQISGGADFDRPITLDPGLVITGSVTDGTTGIPAYLRFMPSSSPNAIVETFSTVSGSFQARLLGQSHQVLAVPEIAGLAPAILTWTTATTTLALGPGLAVNGTVNDPAGVALAGAKVVLASGGVPSTLATTASDGSFTVRTAFVAGATVAITVTPPAGRGLPRLSAAAAFDLTQPMQIRYAAGLATCDLVGTPVQRAAANQPGAKVTVVGTLVASSGMVTAGAAATATGTVEIAAIADGTGRLPTLLVPRAALSAVVAVAAGDLAVATIDTTTCSAQPIVAPAMTMATGVATDASSLALAGVVIEATPSGALAQAGAPPIEVASGSGGAFSLPLATGGSYDVRFSDPAGRAAPLVLLGIGPTAVPPSAKLPVALHVSGVVGVAGSSNAIEGASVQILCAACTGLDATRPIAATATDATSHFLIAIPDPGTM